MVRVKRGNNMSLERVQKTISNAGYCSRRKAELLIKKGLVKVNGTIITIGDKADPEKDEIEVEGTIIKLDEKKIYIALNKPKGYLTTLDDPRRRKTILELLDFKQRLIPIGRLDKDSEGLLLLTNNGDFANKVMHPRYEVKKTYEVITEKNISDSDLKKLTEGIIIDDKKTSKAIVKRASPNKFLITIHEGRNRIIRRMVSHLNNEVLRLNRIAIGTIRLGNLRKRFYRHLTKKEVDGLMNDSKRENHFK